MYMSLCLYMIEVNWLLTICLCKLFMILYRIMISISNMSIYLLSLLLCHWIDLFYITYRYHHILLLFHYQLLLVFLVIFLVWFLFVVFCWRFILIFIGISTAERVSFLSDIMRSIPHTSLRCLEMYYFGLNLFGVIKSSKSLEII